MAIEKKLTSKGMFLKFITPSIENGINAAKIYKTEVEKLSDTQANDAVLYVMGQTPTIGVIMRFINMEWNHVNKPKLFIS